MKTTTVNVKFAPAPKSGLKADDAVIIGTSLKAIEAEDGAIKPTSLVERARPKSSELHRFFTWDNGKAADLWRVEEARMLIRSVIIIRDDMPEKEQAPVRAFSNVRASSNETSFEGQGYISTDRAARHPEYCQQLVNQALSEIKSWRQKYDNIKEFVGIYAEIESVDRQVSSRGKAKKES